LPIRRELRGFYGAEWRTYRSRLIELRGATCKHCGRDVPKWLNLAHETHNPRTSSTILLCATCHQRHDVRHRIAVTRRNHAREFGQLWLLPEIEWAADPPFLVPYEIFAPVQIELFPVTQLR
jgi:hypothetical protein